MRIRFLKFIWLLGCMLACMLAASAEEVLTVHVPFAFMAGGKSFPAGNYRINRPESGSVMLIQGAGEAAAFLTVAAEPGSYHDAATLVFERHDDALVLAAIRLPGERSRVLMPPNTGMKSGARIASVTTSR